MAVVPWEEQLATIIGSTQGTGLKLYQSDEQPASGKCIAIYGRPGAGKTDLVAGLADCPYATPILYLNIEGGAWVFSHRNDIQIIQITQWADFSTLLIRFNGARALPFKTCIVDNVSELQAINVMSIINQRGTQGINGGMPSQNNWGASTAQMLNSLRLCHDMSERFGVNFIFTVWEDARKDSVTNQVLKSGIGVTPALARSLPGIVDIVGHLTVQNDPPKYTRVLNFAANPHSDAKFRRNRTEVANSIPLTIAYQDQQPLVDIFNTLFGGKPWPKEKYAALASKAKVDYATTTSGADGPSDGVVESIVATKLQSSEASSS